MREQALVLVRDGSSSFFFDNWSGKGAIVDMLHEKIDDSLRSLAIRDLYVHGAWDLVALQELIPLEDSEFVRAFDFNFSDAPDEVIWQPTQTGVFTLKSAFELIRKRQPVQSYLNNV